MAKQKMGNIAPIGARQDQVQDPHGEPMPHEVDAAIDTMAKAEAHKADPNMMAAVHQATGKKIHDLKSLKALAAKKSMEGK